MTIIELTTAVLMLSSALGQGTTSAQSTSPIIIVDRSDLTSAKFINYQNRDEVAQYVKDYFSDTPVLAEIARCESTFRQMGLDGEVIRGNVNSDDVGVMQINERYHGKRASELGLDLYTLDGNLSYAKYLYDREGVRPWSSSAKCWHTSEAAGKASEKERNS